MSIAFAAALSTNSDTDAAISEVTASVAQQLGNAPSLVLLFCSAHHVASAPSLAATVCDELKTDCLIGCSGESIVGVEIEVEMQPALSLWAALLPDTAVTPMHLEFLRAADGGTIVGWPDALPETWPDGAVLLALGDPYSFPPELLLNRVNDEHSGVPIIGGMASAASQPGENALLLGKDCFQEGAVAALIQGGVTVRSVVSQGCRPIGKPFVITSSERNVIQELGGVPAYQRLLEVYNTLATNEQSTLQRGLHVGRVVSEYQDRFDQGDFLVRNVTGVDQESGSIVVSDFVRPGQTVQFHLRDAETADAELKQLLADIRRNCHDPGAGLLFTCNGRGTRLFDEPNHDAAAISTALGSIPLAGFFAAGEFGPIAGENFLHGFTASIAIFEANNGSRDRL